MASPVRAAGELSEAALAAWGETAWVDLLQERQTTEATRGTASLKGLLFMMSFICSVDRAASLGLR